MKKAVVVFAILIACSSIPLTVFAGGNYIPNCGNTVPLDGGLSLLALAGIGYGVKRFAKPEKQDD